MGVEKFVKRRYEDEIETDGYGGEFKRSRHRRELPDTFIYGQNYGRREEDLAPEQIWAMVLEASEVAANLPQEDQVGLHEYQSSGGAEPDQV